MIEKMNRDIRIGPGWEAAGELEPLAVNPVIAQAFEQYEAEAVRWKRRYTIAGIAALACSFCGMSLLGYQVILKPDPGRLIALANLIAGTGTIVVTSFLILGEPHARWLIARFGAEWLRCLKFRQFLILGQAPGSATLAPHIRQSTEVALARFDFMMAGGSAAMRFSPDAVIGTVPAATAPLPGDWLDQAKRLYRDLRINVQLQHFEARTQDKEGELRPAHSLGDTLFFIALTLTIAQIVLDGLDVLSLGPLVTIKPFAPAIAYLSWLLFTASAVMLIYERGRNLEVDRERYAYYANEIARCDDRVEEADLDGFLTIVARVERLCLAELRDFCRDTKRSSYWG